MGASDDDASKDGRGHSKVAGNPDAVHRIALSGGKVGSLAVQLRHPDCYE